MERKTLFLCAIFLLSTSWGMAQSAYLTLRAGFGIGFPSDIVGLDYAADGSGFQTRENITGTLGTGAKFALGFGYMIDEHLGFELAGGYSP